MSLGGKRVGVCESFRGLRSVLDLTDLDGCPEVRGPTTTPWRPSVRRGRRVPYALTPSQVLAHRPGTLCVRGGLRPPCRASMPLSLSRSRAYRRPVTGSRPLVSVVDDECNPTGRASWNTSCTVLKVDSYLDDPSPSGYRILVFHFRGKSTTHGSYYGRYSSGSHLRL